MASPPPAGRTGKTRSPWGALLAGGLLVILFVTGYRLYTQLGARLFAQTHAAHALPPFLLLALAVIGGGASFFSPCSLAITPSFLAYFLGAGDGHEQPAAHRVLMKGSALVALGIVAFYAVAGVLVTVIGAVVYAFLIDLIPAVAAGFAALGVIILSGRGRALDRVGRLNPAQRLFDARTERAGDHHPSALIAYGAAYGAAAHTCTLPIFLGIVLLPLGTGNDVLAGVSVLLYGFAIATLLMVMALLGQSVLLSARRLVGRRLRQLTGVLFLLTAAYLLRYFSLNYGFSL